MLRTELDNYERLLREYEQQAAEYQKEVDGYREQEGQGSPDPEVKAMLDQKFADLESLYERLTASRKALAETRDATLAASN